MKVLLSKEIKSIFCSSAALLCVIVYPLILGLLLWLFSGSYNIIEGGYASLQSFFYLSPTLLLILIPALTMGSFADEKNRKTLDILFSRPVTFFQIYGSKFLAIFIFLLMVILSTLVYVYSIYELGNPAGNLDLSTIMTSYLSLFGVVMVLISIGIFSSSCTNNQILAFVLAILLNLLLFYGFDFLALFADTGSVHNFVSSLGLIHHYRSMHRGVIEFSNIVTIINYVILFMLLTTVGLNKTNKKSVSIALFAFLIINLLNMLLPYQQFDFTTDKRYTLSNYTIELLKYLKIKDEKTTARIYLMGDLNHEFQYLQDALNSNLSDMNKYAENSINVIYQNPYTQYNSLEEMHQEMEKKGMRGIVLNEIDREGKASQKIIYPYIEIETSEATLTVSLLKNIEGYAASENINASIENIEFELVDALRVLNQKEPKHIAFLEGHGELSSSVLDDAEEILSKYYFVNRGSLESNNLEALKMMDAIIIAGTSEKYTDAEKYLIDQYIMSGGKTLWLIDGIRYSAQDLMTKGHSATIKNETNLDDILFSYGVRINANLIQDEQCTSLYVVSGNSAESSVLIPNYYSPLLMPSLDNPITKNIRDVKASFASSIDLVNNKLELDRKILLTTSANTRLINASETIDFDLSKTQEQKHLFDQSFVPVAISQKGKFKSAFSNRLVEDNDRLNESPETKMVVVSNSSIIANESKSTTQAPPPMGYDRVSKQLFGNRDFLINTLNWMTDDDGWMELRNKKQEIRILNRKKAVEERDKYAFINIFCPIMMGLISIGGVFFYRKRKYSKIK